MEIPTVNPTLTVAWHKLQSHFETISKVSMKEMFAKNPDRADQMSIVWNDFYIDFSKNRLDAKTIALLIELSRECKLDEAIKCQFAGEEINQTEGRAVLHTALRANSSEKILVDGENVMPEIAAAKKLIKNFTEEIHSGKRVGFTGKNFTDVINIGIGGSDLGPAMVVDALEYYNQGLKVHFVSNIDGDHVHSTISKLNPETTLFVVVSKTFTTQETLTNATTIKKWFLQKATKADVAKHFVAVSTNIKKVTAFGIDEKNVFPMWDWVGGRFSLWSAVGISISLSVGYENFEKLLNGANKMDKHFAKESFEKNIPVLLAMIGIWYNNFYKSESEAIVPYAQSLQKLAPYLQQAIMESNGKSVDRNGDKVDYQTGGIIWGEPGTNSQHAFFQLIHQGTKLIPVDFIGFNESLYGDMDHHNKLMSNYFAQMEALLNGKNATKVEKGFNKNDWSTGLAEFLLPFKVFEGNKPTTAILIDKLTPESLGSLIAMYEHKIFVQGVIWNIFSYDQWGVELGKYLATSILEEIETEKMSNHDASTTNLLKRYM